MPRYSSPPSAPADRPVVTTGKKKPAQSDADTQLTRGACARPTRFVTKGEDRYYEIEEALSGAATHTYVTRSEQLFKEASSVEGFDHHVMLSWQHGNKGGTRVRVLTALALDEGQLALEAAS